MLYTQDKEILEILRVAKELGINYELDSHTPGLFIQENSMERKMNITELFVFESKDVVQDIINDVECSLSKERKQENKKTLNVPDIKVKNTIEIELSHHFFNMLNYDDFNEVA